MFGQVALAFELSPTVYTRIRLVSVSPMSFHMSGQSTLVCQPLLTLSTTMRFLSRVDSLMSGQVALPLEFLPTEGQSEQTYENTCVQ